MRQLMRNESLFHVATYDVSIARRPELVEVGWNGDDEEQGETFFLEECERIGRMVRDGLIEAGSTQILLRSNDGTVRQKKII